MELSSGQRFEDFLREQFFAPLAMTHSFRRPAFFADWPEPRTIGHRLRADGQRVRHDVTDGEAFAGGSNLYFSARDLSRWAMAFARATVPGSLPDGVLRAALAPMMLDDGRRLGLTQGNWYCEPGTRRCQYSGHLDAFHSVVLWDRDRGTSAVYVSNNTLEPWQHAQLARELAAAAAGAPPPARSPRPVLRIARDALPAVAGVYQRSAGRGRIELRVEAGRLLLRDAAGVTYRAFAATPEVRYVPGLDLWFGFARDGTLLLRSVAGDEAAARVDGAG